MAVWPRNYLTGALGTVIVILFSAPFVARRQARVADFGRYICSVSVAGSQVSGSCVIFVSIVIQRELAIFDTTEASPAKTELLKFKNLANR
jgi:hypothetical protein